MYKKHPEKIINESYTGLEIPIASFSMILFLSSLFLSFLYFEFLYLAIVSLFAFFATYTGFFKFIYQKEPQMLFKAIIVIFSRTLTCFLGFGWGVIGILRGR